MLDRILIGASSTETTDPNFKNVTLLLHGDGSNGAQNNTFIDSSANNFTITRNGNTTQGSFSPYGSNWSNYFDGNGDWISIPDSAALQMGNSDFTYECWLYPTAIPNAYQTFIEKRAVGGYAGVLLAIKSSGKYSILVASGSSTWGIVDETSIDATLNAWQHLAVVRSGSTFSVYLNGERKINTTISFSVYDNTSVQGIGAGDSSGNQPFYGYISNVRIVKGTAVYSGASFTPPTAPLTAITNTSLLTCAYNRFRDGSTNNFTITRNGDVKVTNFAPFAPSSAYSASANGGSAYFDGSGDYLSAPSNAAFAFGTGDFTLECWAYLDGNPGVITGIFDTRNSSSSSGGILCQIDRDFSNALRVEIGGSQVFLTSQTVPLRQWNHIAIVRSSGTVKAYLNGSAMTGGSAANSTNITDTNMRWGGDRYGYYVYGYISNARVVNGTAVYTANFTPPSSPVTAVTNTQLLLNATNAAIFDNSMKNDLETVGNAQISTSVKKFGTGSMYFDGNGDYLHFPYPTEYFASNSWTIESWVYFNSLASNVGIVGYSDLMFTRISSSAIRIEYRNNPSSPGWMVNESSYTFSTGTWYHIAFVLNNGSFRTYINGTAIGSASTGVGAGAWGGTGPQKLIIGATDQYTFDSVDTFLNGYMDEVRITNGVARYTANFTAPTAPFPNK